MKTMKATTTAFVTAAVIVSMLLAAQTHAAIIPVPAGLNAGDQYRLVFTTNAGFRGDHTLGEFDAFVQYSIDNATDTSLKALGGSWQALVSVGTTDAKTHTGTSGIGVPIYLVDGNKVADNYADFWDGDLDHAINKTENDTTPPPFTVGYTGVWTGTTEDGTVSAYGALGDGGFASIGQWSESGVNWMDLEGGYGTESAWFIQIYGISSVFTAPEPASLALMGLAGLALIRRRRKA